MDATATVTSRRQKPKPTTVPTSTTTTSSSSSVPATTSSSYNPLSHFSKLGFISSKKRVPTRRAQSPPPPKPPGGRPNLDSKSLSKSAIYESSVKKNPHHIVSNKEAYRQSTVRLLASERKKRVGFEKEVMMKSVDVVVTAGKRGAEKKVVAGSDGSSKGHSVVVDVDHNKEKVKAKGLAANQQGCSGGGGVVGGDLMTISKEKTSNSINSYSNYKYNNIRRAGIRRASFGEVDLRDFLFTNGVKVISSDMQPYMQIHAVGHARKAYDSLEKFTSKALAQSLKREFDDVYGPAWHCVVGTSFGSFVTHSVGGFLYFSMDLKLYILLFKTAVQRMD